MGRSLIFLVSGLVIIVGMTQIGTNKRMEMLPDKTYDYYFEQQARNVSISMVDQAIQELLNNNDWEDTLFSSSHLPGSGTLITYDQNNISDFISEHGYTPDVGGWNEYKLLLYSEVEYQGYKVATEVLMQRDSFSKYSYYTNQQPTNIYFMSADTLSGPVHTNGTFRVAGSPVFNGLVTSPNMWQGHPWYTNNPQFNGGSNFSSPVKSIPAAAQLAAIRNAAASGGISFTNPIKVEPLPDGTVNITEATSYVTGTNKIEYSSIVWGSTTNYDMSTTNGVISSSDEVFIEGTVNGSLTIHSEDNVQIVGDVYYNDDPRSNPNSSDLLGIVSEETVYVEKTAHTANGSQDLEIFASIMALNNSFRVENYNSLGVTGRLHVYGGIIQESRGPVGTFSGGSINNGYAKKYEYDIRLKYQVPPLFPREAVFSILYWKDKLLEKPST